MQYLIKLVGYILTIIYFTSGLSAQTKLPDTTISVIAYWAKGDTYKFKVTKTKTTWQNDEIKKSDTSQYLASFTVVDSTDTTYQIRWTFENSILNTYKLPDYLTDKLSKYANLELMYTTTESGEFLRIDNWRELSVMVQEMYDEISMELTKALDEEGIKKFKSSFATLTSAFTSQHGVEALLMKEISYLHYPFGFSFKLNDVIRYEDKLPTMFEDMVLRSVVEVWVDTVDLADDWCIILQRMAIRDDDAKIMARKFLSNMGFDEKEIQQIEKGKYQMNDFNYYEYYYYPGIPIYIETKRETVFQIDREISKAIEKVVIEWVE